MVVTFGFVQLSTSTSSVSNRRSKLVNICNGLEFEDHGIINTISTGILHIRWLFYVAKTNNVNKQPVNIPDWDLFVTGSSLKGDYDNATAYKTGDVVRVGGSTI